MKAKLLAAHVELVACKGSELAAAYDESKKKDGTIESQASKLRESEVLIAALLVRLQDTTVIIHGGQATEQAAAVTSKSTEQASEELPAAKPEVAGGAAMQSVGSHDSEAEPVTVSIADGNEVNKCTYARINTYMHIHLYQNSDTHTYTSTHSYTSVLTHHKDTRTGD